MKYHKLLNKQINKLLPKEYKENPELTEFFNAISNSYTSFDRDNELMNYAFNQSEIEYQELYQDITKEYKSKQESINKFYKSLKKLDENIQIKESKDLIELADYFSELILKRKQIEEELNKQFNFQNLLMKISSKYINIPFEEINNVIKQSLKELAEFVNADRSYIFHYDFEAGTTSNIYEYCAEDIIPQIDELQDIPLESLPEWVEANVAGKNIHIPDINKLENKHLKELLSSQNIKSLLVIPLMQKNNCLGFVGFDSVKEHHKYGKTEIELLTLFAKVLSNAQERYMMESKLTRTIELLKKLLENLQYGILVEDENRKILFTNQLFCKTFHINASPDDLIGFDCIKSAEETNQLFLEKEQFSVRINEILAKREIVTNELLETKDGRFLERDYIPIFINKTYQGHLWKYNNVTKRIVTHQLLEQSEERNRLIMNSAINAIITIDCKGIITFWNKSAESIFGWKSEEVVGKKLTQTIIPEEFKEQHSKGMNHYIETGEGPVLNKQIELPAIRKTGEEFPIEISIIPIEHGDKKFFCSFIQDISDRKRAENNLKVQEEKYRNIIANMNLGLLEVDNDEVIQFANQGFFEVSGYNQEDLIGKNPKDVFLYNKLSSPILRNQIELRKQGISSIFQIPIKNKFGEQRWWAVSGAPNYDDKGKLIGSIGIHLDITDQKNLEEELRKEKEKALEASKAKEAFLASMSHEIRTPLNAIIGFLRELNQQNLTSNQNSLVEYSTNASKHLLTIINNILDISKIEAGEMSMDFIYFSLQNSIKNIVNILQTKTNENKVKLHYAIEQEISPVFYSDVTKIEQILYNLIGNSLKFTQNGEIEIKCSLIQNLSKNQKIKISVSDTGIGMEKEFLDSIFKKFQQEDAAIARKYGGTGLGMTITKELINLLNGKISITSKKNKGTQIDIILTLRKGTTKKIKLQNEIPTNISIKGTSVLLVEDNELNRLVAQNSLQNLECIYNEARNGREAIEILSKKQFDVILMDIQMPELDGIETTEILRNQMHLKTPIIALTANAFKTEIEKCKIAGMNDFITKPFTEELLLKTIHNQVYYSQNKPEIPIEKNIVSKNYNLNSIKTLSRGNEEFVKKMILIFINQSENNIPIIHQLFQQKKYDEIAKIIHKLKPSIDAIGISSIKNDINIIEKKLSENKINHTEIYTIFIKIEETLISVIKQLKAKEL